MKLICLADTHNKHHDIPIPEGDILIHAGDCTDGGTRNETENFLQWFSRQPHKHKILVPGNHDFYFEKVENIKKIPGNIHILIDQGLELEGLKFWGSPVTPGLRNWAFNRERGDEIKKHWDLVPVDTQVLITHTPPYGILDEINNGTHLGCEELNKILPVVEPDFHLFGHIHPASGILIRPKTSFFNLALLDEDLRVLHSPHIINI